MDIAVIGGGVSGLAVAFNVIKVWQANGSNPSEKPNVTVYEKAERFGGNGDTVSFYLGNDLNGDPINRWADLGVNDFNATAYVEIVKVMTEIGYLENVNYRPLEDSTSYYTLDGEIAYAMGGNTTVETTMPTALVNASNAFMLQAAQDATNPIYANYTVQQYMDEVFSKNPDYDPRLGPLVIYPRVNGMYFNDEVDPTSLPLRAVMHYYMIQEGAGGKPARRMYFVGGTITWITMLTNYMENVLGITLKAGTNVELARKDDGWDVTLTSTGDTVYYDKLVVATHADTSLKLLSASATPKMVECLSKISYLNGICVVHTYSNVFSPDYNAWMTYNILIHQPPETALKPYVISYVCNQHQNDAANPNYNYFGGPLFFVTINPPVPIPNSYVLIDSATKKPAIANLRHNVLNFECLEAQVLLPKIQGDRNLYFAGGWTLGAGLHEECWIQGQTLGKLIVDGMHNEEHYYNHSPDAEHFAPRYLRQTVVT